MPLPYEVIVGLRYLKAKRKQTFISIITFISIAGIAVGVMALIVVLAVMTGFQVQSLSEFLGVEVTAEVKAPAIPPYNPEKAKGVSLNLHFQFSGEDDSSATILIKDGRIQVMDGHVGKPNLKVQADAGTWVKLVNEEISTFKAIVSGKLKVKGNPLLMNKFKSCLMK